MKVRITIGFVLCLCACGGPTPEVPEEGNGEGECSGNQDCAEGKVCDREVSQCLDPVPEGGACERDGQCVTGQCVGGACD